MVFTRIKNMYLKLSSVATDAQGFSAHLVHSVYTFQHMLEMYNGFVSATEKPILLVLFEIYQ